MCIKVLISKKSFSSLEICFIFHLWQHKYLIELIFVKISNWYGEDVKKSPPFRFIKIGKIHNVQEGFINFLNSLSFSIISILSFRKCLCVYEIQAVVASTALYAVSTWKDAWLLQKNRRKMESLQKKRKAMRICSA